jgi:hypothetical protein
MVLLSSYVKLCLSEEGLLTWLRVLLVDRQVFRDLAQACRSPRILLRPSHKIVRGHAACWVGVCP